MVYVNIYLSKLLKEELAWAMDKWFRIVSNTYNVSYTTKKLKNKAILILKQYCICCYVTLSNVSN